jgi:pyridoxamine 5'-phosphate oxidase family protein
MGAFTERELNYLREQELGRIATVSKKQLPQVTPVAFGVDEERLYVNIKHTSQKARNIARNPRVSFLVDDASPWGEDDVFIRGVLVSGEAELVSSGVFHGNGLYGVREDGWSKYILVITPTKVQSWGLK